MADTELENAQGAVRDLTRRLEGANKLTVSARLRLRTAQAILHLLRHDPGALSNNAWSRIENEMTLAVQDIEKADTVADLIPF